MGERSFFRIDVRRGGDILVEYQGFYVDLRVVQGVVIDVRVCCVVLCCVVLCYVM